MTENLFDTSGAASRREFGRIYPPDGDWLARQRPEAILEPELPIVDAHYHVFDLPGFRYLADELATDLQSGHRIEASVYVDAQTHYRSSGPASLRPVGETEFVARLSGSPGASDGATGNMATGIVGYADVAMGAGVEEVLAAHVAAGQGRFRGIRYAANFDSSPLIVAHHRSRPGVMAEPGFRDGLRKLAAMGLSFDAWVFFHQLDEVARVAAALPDLNIVLGHCGGPLGYGPYADRHDEMFRIWSRNMEALVKFPNISVKLGGVLMRLATFDYLNSEIPMSSLEMAACLRPYVTRCIELFGAERCMFESNFPVEKMVTQYAVLWNAFKRITACASRAEKQALYGGTARRVYRLDP